MDCTRPFSFQALQGDWEGVNLADDQPVRFDDDNMWCGMSELGAAVYSFTLMGCLEYDVPWWELAIGDADAARLVMMMTDYVLYKVLVAFRDAPYDYAGGTAHFSARARFMRSVLHEPPVVGSADRYRPLLEGDAHRAAITFAFNSRMKDKNVPCVNRTLAYMSGGTETGLPPVVCLNEAVSHGFYFPSLNAGNSGEDAHIAIGLNFTRCEAANHMSSASLVDLDVLSLAITKVMSDPDFLNRQRLGRLQLQLPRWLLGGLWVGTRMNMVGGYAATISYHMSGGDSIGDGTVNVIDALMVWVMDKGVLHPYSANSRMSALVGVKRNATNSGVEFRADARVVNEFLVQCNDELGSLNGIILDLAALAGLSRGYATVGMLRVDVTELLNKGPSDPGRSIIGHVTAEWAASLKSSFNRVFTFPDSWKSIVPGFLRSRL